MEILQADDSYNFAAKLKEVSRGCKDTVLPDPNLKIISVKFFKFEENTREPYIDNLCPFRALPLHFYEKERLEEETSKLFNLILKETRGTDPAIFRSFCEEDIAADEDIVQADVFLYVIDIVDGSLIWERARKSVGNYSNIVQLLRYKSHLCYVSEINSLLRAYQVHREINLSTKAVHWSDI